MCAYGCVYVSVCICVCMSMCICILWMCVCIWMCICSCVHMSVCSHMCAYRCVCACVCPINTQQCGLVVVFANIQEENNLLCWFRGFGSDFSKWHRLGKGGGQPLIHTLTQYLKNWGTHTAWQQVIQPQLCAGNKGSSESFSGNNVPRSWIIQYRWEYWKIKTQTTTAFIRCRITRWAIIPKTQRTDALSACGCPQQLPEHLSRLVLVNSTQGSEGSRAWGIGTLGSTLGATGWTPDWSKAMASGGEGLQKI